VVGRQSWAAILLSLGFSLLAGCAFRSVGFVESAEDQTILMEVDGDRHRLALGEGGSPVEHLDGHLVEIVGRKGLGGVRVDGWRALEGPHGLSVWVGPVQRSNRDVGIQDPASGLVWVDRDAARELAPFAGDLVAVEGYLQGDRLVVQYWRPLVDQPSSGSFRP
jgi:hypothetical protein